MNKEVFDPEVRSGDGNMKRARKGLVLAKRPERVFNIGATGLEELGISKEYDR